MPASAPASLPFTGAAVVPAGKGTGALAVLHYGKGFGSVVIVEAKGQGSAAQQSSDLQKQLAKLPPGARRRHRRGRREGKLALHVGCSSSIEWQQSGVTYVATGMVPRDTLTQLAASVH